VCVCVCVTILAAFSFIFDWKYSNNTLLGAYPWHIVAPAYLKRFLQLV